MESKIIPLATYQSLLSWISVCPAAPNTAAWKRMLFKIYPIVLFGTDLAGLICSVVFFGRFITINLEKSLYALFQISAVLGMANSIIVTFLLRKKFPKMFKSLTKIHEAITERELIAFLVEANERSEWIWQIYLQSSVMACLFNVIIMPSVSVAHQISVYCGFDSKSVYHAFYVILPWNQDTLWGYFAEVCFSINVSIHYMFATGLQLMLFISICLHHLAFFKIFRQILSKLNGQRKAGDDKELLCELIRFRISVEKWFLETSNLYSPYILVQLICFMIFLASNIFQLDLQLRHPGLSLTLILALTTISTSNLILYCLFGKLATESALRMADCLYESNWPELSIDLQKYLIIMIANAQTPIYYHGFGMAVLNLQTFTKILRVTLSYYMMFKTLTNN